MRYLKLFEDYKISDIRSNRDVKEYYFETDDFQYKVMICKYQGKDGYYSVAFKAKKPEDFFYSSDVITNQNPFKVMRVVMSAVRDFYKENPYINGFIFSFTGDKDKNLQRLELYKRYIGDFANLSFNAGIYFLTINK
jgi:hypothetical protein